MNSRILRTPIALGMTILLALFLTGCRRAYGVIEGRALEQNLKGLLDKHKITADDLRCTMQGTSRTGACQLPLTSEQVSNLAKALQLRPADSSSSSNRETIEYQSWVREGGCTGLPEFGSSINTQVYKSSRRAQELKLSNGQSFEYLLLYWVRQTDQACIQVSYAYG